MAVAIFELAHFMISPDFQNLQPDDMRVILVGAGPRLTKRQGRPAPTIISQRLMALATGQLIAYDHNLNIRPEGV
ncbi:hypothetical protein [Rhizobium leguminosarum]|uniref:hypothetical protein n=1 Tax=Rhizobium leguminosarum TaxID=384 RepID=UPI001FDF2845|nr:hypothetical protein [Rhizobium leguminosarum]